MSLEELSKELSRAAYTGDEIFVLSILNSFASSSSTSYPSSSTGSSSKFLAPSLPSPSLAFPLHPLFQSRHPHLFLLLLSHSLTHDSFDLHSVDSEGNSYAHLASKFGDLDCIKLLVNRKCDVSSKNVNEKGFTCLHWAAMQGRLNVIEYLLNECNLDDHNQLNAQDEEGFTPLHRAVDCDQEEVVLKLLLTNKCNPNLRRKDTNSTCLDDTVNPRVKEMITRAGGYPGNKMMLCLVM